MEILFLYMLVLSLPFGWYFAMTMEKNELIKNENWEYHKTVRELQKENVALRNENRAIVGLEEENEKIEREARREREKSRKIIAAQVAFEKEAERKLQECALLGTRQRELEHLLGEWKDHLHKIEAELAVQKR